MSDLYSTLTEGQLDKLARNIKNFETYAIDELPPKLLPGHCGIINSAHRETGGKHWTAFVNAPKKVYVFDSFGAPTDPRIIRFLKSTKQKKQVQSNTGHLQDLSAESCGMWCIKFIRYIRSGGDLIGFISNFSTSDQNKNEDKLKKI